MKIWAFSDKLTLANKLICIFGLILASQGFAVESWEDSAIEPKTEKIDGKDYRLIYKAEELAWVAKNTDHPESQGNIPNVKLMANIDLGGKLWTPICAGKGTPHFDAVFDGNGFFVENMYIKGSELLEIHDGKTVYIQNIGFIGVLGSGTVKNLTLKNVNILATNDDGTNPGTNEISVGGLVGWKNETASGTIDGVSVSGTITVSGKGQGIGGIVGNAKAGTIKNSISTVSIYASGNKSYIGGVVGLTKADLTVESCVYAGENLVNTGKDGAIGAVVGDHRSGTLTTSGTYYDSGLFDSGVGKGTVTSTNPVEELNTEEVICKLNKGNLDENGECDTQEPWSVGFTGISLKGSDGFKVVFDANGGTFPNEAKTFKMLSMGNTITADEISVPAKDGYSFAGWSLEKDALEPLSDLGVVSKATRIYAVWNPLVTVTFDATDGYFPPENPVVKTKEKTVAIDEPLTVEGLGSLPESFCSKPSETGCDEWKYFAGWSFDKDASADETVDLNELKTFISKDTTLYAIWTTEEMYTVTFHADGHGKTKVAFVKVKAGSKVEKMEATPDAGYVFKNWLNEGKPFDFENTKIDSSIILYADWGLEEYVISYNLDGGTNASSNRDTYTVEDSFNFENPSREGYTFVKWCYDADCSEPASKITQGTTGNKNLYAKWNVITYTITYLSGNSVAGTTVSDKKEYGKSIALKGAVEAFNRSGYIQDGWSLTDGGDKAYELGAAYNENAGLVLYPHWVEGLVKVEKFGGVTVYEYENHNEVVIDGSSMEEIDIPQGFTASSVVYERTFEIGAYSTLVLPFSIDVEKVFGATFYALAGVVKGEDGKWKNVAVYEMETGMLEANTPYIVVAKKESLTFEGSVQFESTRNAEPVVVKNDDGSRWLFKPTYQKLVFGDLDEYGRAYGFAAEAKDGAYIGKFVKAGPKAWMRPMRAYLVYEPATDNSTEVNSAGKSASLTLSDEMEVFVQEKQAGTAERTVLNARRGVVRMDRWYDLQGRKLNGKPETRGTYYHNGKRVIVK